MRFFNRVIFDELAQAGVSYQTDCGLDDLLGQYDSFALQAIVENPSGTTGTLLVQIFHSADAENWLAKSASPEINKPVSASGVTTLWGTDTTNNPNLQFVRVNVALVTVTAKVRIFATGRDTDTAGDLGNEPYVLADDGGFRPAITAVKATAMSSLTAKIG